MGGIARILLPLPLSAIHSLCGPTLSLAHPRFLRLIYTVIGSEKAVVQETMLNQADCRGQGGKGKGGHLCGGHEKTLGMWTIYDTGAGPWPLHPCQ